jgi:GntR family transcriptional regulator
VIDRDSPIPYYVQVKKALQDHMESGGLQPGDQLPGEPELCRLFDVSRTVIRQALREMEFEGLIVREKGKGTFVARPKISEGLFQELTGFHQDMVARGHAPRTRVFRQELVPAGAKVAGLLQIQPETPVVAIDRLRTVGGEPMVYVTTYVPHAMCPDLLSVDLSSLSLYTFMEERYGLVIAHGHRSLEAVPANEYEAELLQVEPGAPLMMLNSVSYLEDGTPIEYYHALHRGDRARFEVELVRIRQKGDSRELMVDESHVSSPIMQHLKQD